MESEKRSLTTQFPPSSAGLISRLDMVAARGEMQEGLGHGIPLVPVAGDEETAYRFRSGSTAGFARLNHGSSGAAQLLAEQAHLRRLARALAAFQTYETSFSRGVHKILTAGPFRRNELRG